MEHKHPHIIKRLFAVSGVMLLLLFITMFFGIALGSTSGTFHDFLQALFKNENTDTMLATIVWKIRFPRVILAAFVGAALSLGGLIFQVLLRNPLAEPYILGISGGSAIGAIIGILIGFSRFIGVSIASFAGSIVVLLLILAMTSSQSILKKDSLLLSGVMVNSFCLALITFFIAMTQDSRLHTIMFWLMGDLSMIDLGQVGMITVMLLPCYATLFLLSGTMNLLLLGDETAQTMGVNVPTVKFILLVLTSFMVSVTVSQCGLIGFVGLIIPHLMRLILGQDHRVLVPACILGGGSYMILCDLLARVLPRQGEMPSGVITAMIGAPLFIILLKRSGR